MRKLPTYLDRYPAKMVSRLADRLVNDYAGDAKSLLDPFCGSGAIIFEGAQRGISSHGIDINPYGVLLSKVKIEGFDSRRTKRMWADLRNQAFRSREALAVDWEAKDYWFTPATLQKYEQLRAVLRTARAAHSHSGRAILLAYALSVRRCSRADQRSPKPFISKIARQKRFGHHYDPILEIDSLLQKLCGLYGQKTGREAHVKCGDVVKSGIDVGIHTHVITSPPYINAQDYFRNFKLELYLLEGLLDFSVAAIKERFIGTERGNILRDIPQVALEKNLLLVDGLKNLRRKRPREASIVDRYCWDMSQAIKTITGSLVSGGKFVLVCGDNLVAGQRIPTWRVLNSMVEERGLVLQEQFGDKIECRQLPPKRNGHKALIKQEVVSVFVKPN